MRDRLHGMVMSDPVSAVGLTAQGDLRFPGSPMSEDRALLAIRALVNLHMPAKLKCSVTPQNAMVVISAFSVWREWRGMC